MPNARVKSVLFDVYGTLLNPFSIENQANQLMADGSQFVALWRSKQLEYSWLISLMGRYENFWQLTERALTYTCRRLNVSLTSAQQQQLLACWTQVAPFEDVQEGLIALQAQNVRLGALSNGNPEMLEAGLVNAGIRQHLEMVLSVAEVGIYKPSPRVYELAMHYLDVTDPAQVGFVSSNSWDAIGATAFGFQVAWLNRGSNVLDPLDFVPAFEVSNFTQIVEVFSNDTH